MRKPQTSKSTIKNDPFATVIPLPSELEIPEQVQPEPVATKAVRSRRVVNADRQEAINPSAPEATKSGKQKLTVHVEPELAERVRNAVYWNPRLTIVAIAEQGIKHALEKYEREHGGKYPPREGELIGGRPVK